MFWGYSKQLQNKHRVKQESLIKFLMPEKCKLYKIYRGMSDVYGEACFSKKKSLEMV